MKTKILSFFITCLVAFGVQAQIDRSVQPEPGPAPKINLEEPETFDLDNGMKVMVVENHKLPVVTARLVIDNKPHSEAKPGTAALLSAMLGTGTEKISKDDYIEEIDFMGASVSFGSESAYANSLSKFFPRVFELMAKGALNPKFTQEEFESQKSQLIEGLKFSEKDVSSIASRMSNVLAFGKNHPYGEFATPESVESISLQDVISYYQTYFAPENAYLVVVGDIDDDKVKDLVEDHFEDWKKATPPVADLPAINPVKNTQINFVDMPNADQSELRVQNTIDIKMSDEDYFPLLIANQILGGSFGSYLNMNLREKHGFTYGARTSFDTDKYGASNFVASTSVRNAVTDSAIVETIKEIRRIRSEKVTEKDLELAKSKFTGNFVMALERPSTIAQYALNIETQNLDDDFYENYLQKIEGVTAEEVMRVAKKYFNADQMRIIVVGKGAEVVENLESLKLQGKSVPVNYFDKLGNSVKKPVFNKPIPAGVTVQSVYDAYIKAIGGKEAAQKVNSVIMTGTANFQGRNFDVVMKQTKDGKFLNELTMQGMVLNKSVFNGETGYNSVQGQKMDFTAEEIAEAKKEAGIFPELKPDVDSKLTGIETVNGEEAYVISSSDGKTKNFYSVTSGLKLQTLTIVEQMGQTVNSTTGYSNYKTVNGIQYPHTRILSPPGLEITINTIQVNEGITDADFQ
ncbi:MAG TPA: pitrilysin family protein [Salinimicrobium sp.]|nr:pitrilysin family protein [Salinimicrobium sp.]